MYYVPHTCQPSRNSRTVPETDVVSRCPGNIQICPGNYSRGKCINTILLSSKYKSERDGMLAGQDQCQPQDGCQWVRSSEPLPKGVSKQVAAMVERESL